MTLLFLDSFFVQHAGAVVSGSMPKNGGSCPPPRAWPQSKRFAASEGLGPLVLVARRRRLHVWVDKARVIIFLNRRWGTLWGWFGLDIFVRYVWIARALCNTKCCVDIHMYYTVISVEIVGGLNLCYYSCLRHKTNWYNPQFIEHF